jgi:hypothetical protein
MNNREPLYGVFVFIGVIRLFRLFSGSPPILSLVAKTTIQAGEAAAFMNVFSRYEKKYRVDQQTLAKFIKRINVSMRADKCGLTQIASLYLDTPDQLLVSRSIEKPAYKEKLRLRVYSGAGQNLNSRHSKFDNSSTVFLEIKKKFEGKVYKRRAALSLSEARNLVVHGITPEPATDNDRQQLQITRELAYSLARYGTMEPYLWVSCLRRSFAERVPSAASLRITCDTDLSWQQGCWEPASQDWQPFFGNSQAVIEIKSNEALPLWLTHLLDELQMYPQSFSKIAMAHTLNRKAEDPQWINYSNHFWQAPKALRHSRRQNSSSALPSRSLWGSSALSSTCTGVPTTKAS